MPKIQAKVESALARIAEKRGSDPPFLEKSWRPITMLVFVGLIVARWLGFTAPGLSEAEYMKLWSIVELTLGSYIVGRSVEKIIPGIIKRGEK